MTNPLPSYTFPEVTVALDASALSRKCAAPCCHELVTDRRICEDCFLSSAIVAALMIESDLEDLVVPGTSVAKRALESAAYDRGLDWYQKESPVGRALSFEEAMHLRSITDAICILIARGGHRAIEVLQEAAPHTLSQPARPRQPRVDLGVIPEPVRWNALILLGAFLLGVVVLCALFVIFPGSAR